MKKLLLLVVLCALTLSSCTKETTKEVFVVNPVNQQNVELIARLTAEINGLKAQAQTTNGDNQTLIALVADLRDEIGLLQDSEGTLTGEIESLKEQVADLLYQLRNSEVGDLFSFNYNDLPYPETRHDNNNVGDIKINIRGTEFSVQEKTIYGSTTEAGEVKRGWLVLHSKEINGAVVRIRMSYADKDGANNGKLNEVYVSNFVQCGSSGGSVGDYSYIIHPTYSFTYDNHLDLEKATLDYIDEKKNELNNEDYTNHCEEVIPVLQTFTEKYGGYYRKSNATADRLYDVGLGKFIIHIYENDCYTTINHSGNTSNWVETPFSLEFDYTFDDGTINTYRWEFVNGTLNRLVFDETGFSHGRSKYTKNEDITDYICK